MIILKATLFTSTLKTFKGSKVPQQLLNATKGVRLLHFRIHLWYSGSQHPEFPICERLRGKGVLLVLDTAVSSDDLDMGCKSLVCIRNV